MEPLFPAKAVGKTEDEIHSIAAHLAANTDQPFARILSMVRAEVNAPQDLWMNDTYTVIREDCEDWVHLSIRRNDREPVTDWRDKQEIKNQLVGEECEGLELFPAESRVVDTANQYHLWVIRSPGAGIGVGFHEGRHVFYGDVGGAVQRGPEDE